MKVDKFLILNSLCILLLLLSACTTETPQWNDPWINGGMGIGGGNGSVSDDSTAPDLDPTIVPWSGETADDGSQDVLGTDKDIYHELNSFDNVVTVAYKGSEATVTSNNQSILVYKTGAYVTVDMLTNEVSGVEIKISGTSEDAGLKIYGSKKFKLTLDGVDLKSKRGPVINSQCKKRIYVDLAEGKTNRLQDVATYTDDAYYLPSSVAADEDRKGAFFSEGNLIFSGKGILEIAGKYKHGLVTDGYMWVRPGVTIVVTEAAKNAIHVKGDTDDNIGLYMAGGLIYANVSSAAGKGIKTDLNVEVAGGKLLLNTSGEAIYDADEKDTSSAACIKTDGDVIITGGTHTLKSTGMGGKGINADNAVKIYGGVTNITTSGGKYKYSNSLTSSPKGVKADGDIYISGGKINVSVTGISDGSEGIESKSNLEISGSEVYVNAYDDGINAAKILSITGGKVFSLSKNNDGIDSNGSLIVSGGLAIAIGGGSPENGFDCENSNNFLINGGIAIGCGGAMMANPSSSSKQRMVIYNGVSVAKESMISILNSNGSPILTFEVPSTMNGIQFFFSTPDLASGATYTLSTGGKLTDSKENWNGWYSGGAWSGGTAGSSFTTTNIITTVGSSGGMGGIGGGGGFPGGWH